MREFQTHNDGVSCSHVEGTSLQGHINIKYEELVELFGKPKDVDDGKVQVEWIIVWEDGVVSNIYDWKNRLPIERIRNWTIGGHSSKSVEYIRELISVNCPSGRVTTL